LFTYIFSEALPDDDFNLMVSGCRLCITSFGI